jgi:hypothetical protein
MSARLERLGEKACRIENRTGGSCEMQPHVGDDGDISELSQRIGKLGTRYHISLFLVAADGVVIRYIGHCKITSATSSCKM